MCTPSSNSHPLADFRYCPRCGSDTFAPHDEKSNSCPACGFTYYYNPAAATAALILNDRNELLVCRRANDPARGTLDLPGGFCDVGETAEEGVVREVAEETGLRVLRADFLFSLPNSYLFSGFVVATVDMFFRCRVAKDEAQPEAHDNRAGEDVAPSKKRRMPRWMEASPKASGRSASSGIHSNSDASSCASG